MQVQLSILNRCGSSRPTNASLPHIAYLQRTVFQSEIERHGLTLNSPDFPTCLDPSKAILASVCLYESLLVNIARLVMLVTNKELGEGYRTNNLYVLYIPVVFIKDLILNNNSTPFSVIESLTPGSWYLVRISNEEGVKAIKVISTVSFNSEVISFVFSLFTLLENTWFRWWR